MCMMHCDYGFIVGDDGCQKCDCAEWPGCSIDKQCLTGDIMPMGSDDPNANSLTCCKEGEECTLVDSASPEMGSSCWLSLPVTTETPEDMPTEVPTENPTEMPTTDCCKELTA